MKFVGTLAVGVAGLALIPSMFSQSARPSARKATPKPDVLLITIDTLRADHVGAYGSKNAETPTIDGLARTGVLTLMCR